MCTAWDQRILHDLARTGYDPYLRHGSSLYLARAAAPPWASDRRPSPTRLTTVSGLTFALDAVDFTLFFGAVHSIMTPRAGSARGSPVALPVSSSRREFLLLDVLHRAYPHVESRFCFDYTPLPAPVPLFVAEISPTQSETRLGITQLLCFVAVVTAPIQYISRSASRSLNAYDHTGQAADANATFRDFVVADLTGLSDLFLTAELCDIAHRCRRPRFFPLPTHRRTVIRVERARATFNVLYPSEIQRCTPSPNQCCVTRRRAIPSNSLRTRSDTFRTR